VNALDLAGAALGQVNDADQAQASVTRERSLLMRFARSAPTQATSVDDVTVQLTVLRAGQVGSATTNGTGAEELAACARAAERAAAAAAQAGAQFSHPGLPEPDPPRAAEGHDPATARLDPAVGAAALRACFDAAAEAGLEAHGVWSAGEVERAIASTTGVALRERVTDAFMKTTAIAPDGRSGFSTAAAVAQSGIDPAALARTAVEKATVPGSPARLEPGSYPVVLEPAAVGELLQWLGWTAFNGLAYAEERSALCGRLGQRVVAPSINLSDSPRFAGTLPREFDAEGVPKAPMPLIQDGVAHRVCHDLRTAALAGARTTGHAIEPGGGSWGALPENLVLIGGGAADEAELRAPIERGIHVTRLWYVNGIRPTETLVTGVTRDGTFLIEDGEITTPLEDLRLTDSILGLLGRVEALSSRPVLWNEGEFYGRRSATGVVCPAIRVAEARFTA
jgi:predicted Zn-dependent protease